MNAIYLCIFCRNFVKTAIKKMKSVSSLSDKKMCRRRQIWSQQTEMSYVMIYYFMSFCLKIVELILLLYAVLLSL